jgi:hypothetical protein
LRRSLRALLDGKNVAQLPWCPPIVFRYIQWLAPYVQYGLKIWDVKGFHHTKEWMNMYTMFENLALQAKGGQLKRKVTEKSTARIETHQKGDKTYKTYSDKVNFGDPKSPIIDLIRKKSKSNVGFGQD